MTRLASIDVDLPIATRPPAKWSGEWVRRRLIEAYAIERRIPNGRSVTANNGTAWPPILHEFADVVGWDDARDRVLDAWAMTEGGVYAYEIARMDQAQAWLRILDPHPVERHCLAAWASTIAYRRPLTRILSRKGWSRATFYRRASMGAILIARVLNHRGDVVS